MKGGGWAASMLVVVAIAAFAIGCGGGDQTTDTVRTAGETTAAEAPATGSAAAMPSPGAVADCFRANGATSVYQRSEGDVILVDGLIPTGIVSVELTGDQATSEKVIDKLMAENPGSFQTFEALDGAVVGVYSKGDAAGKRFIGGCLDGSPSPAPTQAEVAACFRREGVTDLHLSKEGGSWFVNGITPVAKAVSVEFTGDQVSTEEALERYETEDREFDAFELLDGQAVGVINKHKPSNRKIVIACLEG